MENGAAAASPQHSQWLHATLSDLEEKMKAMVTLLEEEEDDNSSCQKDHVSPNKKQQLVQMLGELNRSYFSLAHKYDQLRSKSQTIPHSVSSSLSSNSSEIQESSNKRRVVEVSDDPIPDEHYRSGFEYMNKLADDLILTEQCSLSFMTKPNIDLSDEEDVVLNINHGFQRFKPKEYAENTSFQLKFQFTKLMEENLRQQAELLRRNEEKRQTINGLRLQLEQLKSESKVQHQQKCLHCSKTGLKRNHSQTTSRSSTGLFLGKFFHGRCK
ncbi:hypothetical protein PTKIN_Ptkin07bG0003600 [Pterospermum kingtungense]